MKPIGIGNLKTATQVAQIKPLSRHEHREVPAPQDAPVSPEGQLSVDVYQTDTEVIILAPIAGTPPDELNLSITDDVITIKGRRERPLKKALNPEDIYLEECFWGNFSRSIILPAEVDTSRVEARFKHNILTIRVPKVERIKTRKIEIAPS